MSAPSVELRMHISNGALNLCCLAHAPQEPPVTWDSLPVHHVVPFHSPALNVASWSSWQEGSLRNLETQDRNLTQHLVSTFPHPQVLGFSREALTTV